MHTWISSSWCTKSNDLFIHFSATVFRQPLKSKCLGGIYQTDGITCILKSICLVLLSMPKFSLIIFRMEFRNAITDESNQTWLHRLVRQLKQSRDEHFCLGSNGGSSAICFPLGTSHKRSSVCVQPAEGPQGGIQLAVSSVDQPAQRRSPWLKVQFPEGHTIQGKTGSQC